MYVSAKITLWRANERDTVRGVQIQAGVVCMTVRVL